ncbi:MAG: hypothetical protein CXZ00_12760 [Acidobacteria bacterium]|nr:MAG: hypothetical protein CXZ00_12760 [Acidobacteriota bacterium]
MHNPRKIAILIALCMLLGLSISCNRRPSDETIAKEIQNKAAADPATKDSQINVTAKDGKVTLSGNITTPAAQQKLEQIAREQPGATSVDDQTQVISQAPPPEAVPFEPAPPMPPAQAAPQAAPAPGHPSTPARAPHAPAPTRAPAPAAPVEQPKPIVLPAGTVLTVKTSEALSSKDSQSGQTFHGSLAQSVSVGEKTALPAGSDVVGTVVTAKKKGKIKGQGQLDLTLTSVSFRGQTYPIKTHLLANTIKGKGKRTAVTTGGGAGLGALIGGLAGGGKGAGIGAAAGAGAGLAGGALTGNKQIEFPAGAALRFTLSAPLTLPPAR